MLMTQDDIRAALAERDALKIEVTTLKGELNDARQDLSALRRRRMLASGARRAGEPADAAELRHQLAILREENRELRRLLRTAARTDYAPQIP